jgi:hypothetical protein
MGNELSVTISPMKSNKSYNANSEGVFISVFKVPTVSILFFLLFLLNRISELSNGLIM